MNKFTDLLVSKSANMHSNINNTSSHCSELLKEILQNTIETKQSLKDMNNRLEKLEEDNLICDEDNHSRQLTEIAMTQKLLKPRKHEPILKTPFNSVEEFEKFEESVAKSHELGEILVKN